MSFICTAWNNGKHHASGAGYGLKVPMAYRDKYFQKEWKSVTLEPPARGGATKANLKTDKSSFWNSACRELINQEIGRWLRHSGLAPWPEGQPPKVTIEVVGERHFKVVGADG